jgi:HEAT repeat protein
MSLVLRLIRSEHKIGQKLVLDFNMGFVFDTLRKLTPAALLLKAIIAAAVGDMLLLVAILLRRSYRKWYFARRDRKVFVFRRRWDALISGEIPYETWRNKDFDCRIVQTIVLDAFEIAGPEESAQLLRFLRRSGLIEKLIFEARHHLGWRRNRALLGLGQTRAPEGIPALSDGLRDRALDTRLAALRGLEKIACPEAAREILNWISEVGLRVPALPLQSALIQCCRERPQMLLPYLEHAQLPIREVLARVLGEVATLSIGSELLRYADDSLPELRAAAARALGQTNPKFAIDTLTDLANDQAWFVRLRAVISLGQLKHVSALRALLRALGDSHRLVRLRAAEALVTFTDYRVSVFDKIVIAQDRYGLHAYLAALDNSDSQPALETELNTTTQLAATRREVLLNVLHTGTLPTNRDGSDQLSLAAGSQS